MEYRFSDWVRCPRCSERSDVSTLAYRTEMVFECHACGLISEFEIGTETSLQNLDPGAIAESSEE